MSDEPKTEKTAPTEGAAIDPKEVRTQLGLPETATDPEVIAGLLAGEKVGWMTGLEPATFRATT